MKQYVIASLLTANVPPLFKRTEWPLHLTLAGPFFSDHEFAHIAEKMKHACTETRAMTLTGTSRKMFGRDKNVPGTLIERTEELHAFHNRLFDALMGMVTIKIPEHNRRDYCPHVSDRQSGHISPGQTFTLESATLLEYVDDTIIVLATEPIV